MKQFSDIVAARTSMEQIIGNIPGNAVKYLVDPERPCKIEVTARIDNSSTFFFIRLAAYC